MIEGNYIGTTPDGEGFFGSAAAPASTSTAARARRSAARRRAPGNVISGFSRTGSPSATTTGDRRPGEPDRPDASQASALGRRHRRRSRRRRRQQHDRQCRRRCQRDRGRQRRRRRPDHRRERTTRSPATSSAPTSNGTPFSTPNGQGCGSERGDGNTLSHNRISTSNDVGVRARLRAEHGQREPHRLERLAAGSSSMPAGQHDRPWQHVHGQPGLRRSGLRWATARGSRRTRSTTRSAARDRSGRRRQQQPDRTGR